MLWDSALPAIANLERTSYGSETHAGHSSANQRSQLHDKLSLHEGAITGNA